MLTPHSEPHTTYTLPLRPTPIHHPYNLQNLTSIPLPFPHQSTSEELSGALSVEQKRVAELKAQAEAVKKSLEKEQDFVAKLKREMQMAMSESELLVSSRTDMPHFPTLETNLGLNSF